MAARRINGGVSVDPSGDNVSVFIMTYDEETNIERCLESVRWSDDVVILDSFSKDKTVTLAGAYPNVRIFERRFDDYSGQRNHGLHAIAYRNRWLLVVDADEVVEPGLAVEVRDVARARPVVDVFLLRRKVFFDGRWMRWNIAYDFWIERLMRPQAVRYEGRVHEKLRFEGGYGRLRGALEHHQFAKGIDHWLGRRCQYARLEAQSAGTAYGLRPARLLSRDTLLRRSALKALYYRMPARWAVYLAYNLLFKFAYLGGISGLRYICLEAYSQYLVARQVKEARRA